MEIVTSRKPRLENKLKFPIGFEIVDEKFKNITTQKTINLNFSNEIGNKIGVFTPYSFGNLIKLKNKSIDLLEFRQTLVVNYINHQQNWNLRIYPCEIETTSIIKNFIVKIGLEICKNWIESSKNETWYEGQRFLQIGINENQTKYCILETQNEYIIEKQIVEI